MAITATINETFRSRDGTVRGTFGNFYRREFRIRLTGKVDADRTELTEPDPAGFLEALHPFGHAHPWNAFMAANSYGPPRRIAPDLWDCVIGYAVISESNPGTTGWIRSSGGNSIPQRVYTTLPDPERVTAVPTLDGGGFGLSPLFIKEIGDRIFVDITSSGEQSDYTVRTVDVNDDGDVVTTIHKLAPTEFMTGVPEDVDVPGIATTFTKVIVSDGVDLEPIVRGFIKKINAEPFLGGAVATVFLDNFTLEPMTSTEFAAFDEGGFTAAAERFSSGRARPRLIPRDIPLQDVPAWRASLTFIASDVPFDPVERTPVWRSKTGAESVVYYKDEPFIERFLVTPRVDFVDMFRRLG